MDLVVGICKPCAQLYHYQQFIQNEPDKAQQNAQAYDVVNNRNKVNKMIESHPTLFYDDMDDEEVASTISNIAGIMFATDDAEE